MEKYRGRLATFGLLLPGSGLLLAMVAVPVAILIIAGFSSGNTVGEGLTTAHYSYALGDDIFMGLLGKSAVMGLLVTSACILIAYPVSYGLAKLVSRKRSGLLLVMVIIPFFTSQLLLIYSMMVLLQSGGPLMTFLSLFGADPSQSMLYTNGAVFIILVYEFLPYMVMCLYSSISKIDDNKIYAARTLGAGKVKRFTSVIFPMSLPGLMSGILLVFVPVTGSFVEPDLAGGAGGMMVGSLINSNFASAYNLGRGAAFSVIFLILLAAATCVINLVLRRLGRRA